MTGVANKGTVPAGEVGVVVPGVVVEPVLVVELSPDEPEHPLKKSVAKIIINNEYLIIPFFISFSLIVLCS
jgi:hypothetical protein